MKGAIRFLFSIEVLLGALFFTGCETVPEGIQQAKIAMAQHIAAEAPEITLSAGVISNRTSSSGAMCDGRASPGARPSS